MGVVGINSAPIDISHKWQQENLINANQLWQNTPRLYKKKRMLKFIVEYRDTSSSEIGLLSFRPLKY